MMSYGHDCRNTARVGEACSQTSQPVMLVLSMRDRPNTEMIDAHLQGGGPPDNRGDHDNPVTGPNPTGGCGSGMADDRFDRVPFGTKSMSVDPEPVQSEAWDPPVRDGSDRWSIGMSRWRRLHQSSVRKQRYGTESGSSSGSISLTAGASCMTEARAASVSANTFSETLTR